MAEHPPAPHELEPEPICGTCDDCGTYTPVATIYYYNGTMNRTPRRQCAYCCPGPMEDDGC